MNGQLRKSDGTSPLNSNFFSFLRQFLFLTFQSKNSFEKIAVLSAPGLVYVKALPLGVVSLAGFIPDVNRNREKVANDFL